MSWWALPPVVFHSGQMDQNVMLNYSPVAFIRNTFIFSFSILLGIEVIRSRSRILGNFKKEENNYYFENISLAVSSIFLNIIYILLVTPLSVFHFLPNYDQIYGFVFSYYLLYVTFSINFYIILVSNSLFRKQFILFLKDIIKKVFKFK